MRKLFILSLLAMMIAWGIGGCGGGGGGTSADPLETDSIMFADAAGSGAQVNPNGALTLKATVKNASGTAVVGREVSFGFVSNASGATLTSYSANTNGSGEATILYRAGATAGSDVVRASISNGAKMDINITVTGAGGRQITLTGSPASLAAGQNSILTATVTDSSGNVISGQTVVFSFISNLSGAPALTVLNAGLTDGGGRAVAVYTAGSATPNSEVRDTVRAEIVGICTTALILTVAPSVGSLDLKADVTSLAAGQSAVVTATVTDNSNKPAGGQTVTFALLSNNSGASLNILKGGVTDASGRAVAVYTAGATNPTTTVQDTIQASVTGSTGAIVMTRTVAGGGTGVRMTVKATPTSLIAGAMSFIEAEVKNADGTAAAGLAVTFGFVTNNSGAPAFTVINATTDSIGKAIAIYTAGSNSPTLSVDDVVSASVNGSVGAAIITRLPSSGTGNRLSLTITPTELPTPNSNAVLTATVLRDDGTPVANEAVTFSILRGGGTITEPVIVATNNGGTANAIFTGPGGIGSHGEAVVRAEILGTANGGDAVGIISW